jgi:hypothetical protein
LWWTGIDGFEGRVLVRNGKAAFESFLDAIVWIDTAGSVLQLFRRQDGEVEEGLCNHLHGSEKWASLPIGKALVVLITQTFKLFLQQHVNLQDCE